MNIIIELLSFTALTRGKGDKLPRGTKMGVPKLGVGVVRVAR